MAQRAEIWQCPACASRMDVAGLGFYAEITCSGCGHKDYVHTLLANFRLEGVLGVGGMSIVLRGRDVVLNRPVAIKLLNETYRNQPERIARFENECSMMAKVRHENVVSVYSAGWAKDQFYIAMELLEGRNLETLVTKKQPLNPLRAIEIITQVVKGLEAAHHAGMLHRDMKPGNVIITDNGIPKVLDFGLAQGKTEEEDAEEVIWATPFYVAPETLQRSPEDARTDIYSVGMTLRYLLTGIDSLPGKPASVSSLLDAKFHLKPFAQVMPKVHESLCDLVDHMTAFEPANRHENYADLLAELKEVHEALTFEQQERLSPVNRLNRLRNRALTTAGIAVASAASFFLAYYAATPSPVRVPVPELSAGAFAETPSKNEASALIQSINKERWEQVLKHADKLSASSCEPTLAAWGLLHGACAAYLSGSPKERVDALLLAYRQALVAKYHHPAAQDVRRQLQIADIALDSQSALSQLTDSRVAGMVYCLTARRQLDENQIEDAKNSVALAKEAFMQAAEEPYSTSMLKLLEVLESKHAAVFSSSLFGEAADSIAQHDFANAMARFTERLNNTPDNAEEIKVLIEVCECGAVLHDTLARLMGDDYVPGMTANMFCETNSSKKYVAKLREQEFCALLHLFRRDYAAAFKADPYAQKTDSNEPFAVMMRDWKNRLAPYMNE